MKGIADGRWLLTAVLGLAGLGCGSQVPQLITPEEAQDRVYHHLSQAEAFKVRQNSRAASIERTKARAYKDLIRSGRTTTRKEALAAAAAHQSRAASLRALGYTSGPTRSSATPMPPLTGIDPPTAGRWT